METLLQKSLVVVGAILAVCAFAAPSIAAAASWGPFGSTHELFSSDLSFKFMAGIGQLGFSCANSELHAHVFSASAMEITGGRFNNCSGTFGATGCTVTVTGTQFPWTATAPTTSDVQIHRLHLDVRFETRPPAGSTSCSQIGRDTTVTGTLSGATWDPSAVGADRRITLASAHGLTASGLPLPVLGGSLRDTTGTLDLLM
jgi:hypothetical protein